MRHAVPLAFAVFVTIVSSCRSSPSDEGAGASCQLERVAAEASSAVERLDRTLRTTDAGSKTSVVTLRAVAGRTERILDRLDGELRTIEPGADAGRTSKASVEDALGAVAELTAVLQQPSPSLDQLQTAATEARLTLEDQRDLDVGSIDAATYVAELRSARRRAARRARVGAPAKSSGGVSTPVGSSGGSNGKNASSFITYRGSAFQASSLPATDGLLQRRASPPRADSSARACAGPAGRS